MYPPTGSYPAQPVTGAYPAQPPGGPHPNQPPAAGHPGWNPATGLTGWDPRVGPPGWAPQAGYTPPRVPPNDGRWGLSPFGNPARHSWEIPLLVLVVLTTALAYLFALLMFVFGEWNQYVLILVFAPAILWIGRGMNYATMRVNGVKMSPTQFPEGYRLVQEAAERLGMAKAPDAFVVLGNGQINAFASGHGFRRYVAVYSDLFEVGGAARQPEALAFIIGHEVGHIAAGHVSYWRQFGMFLVPFLPFLGNALIRSQEYTADNHGYCFRHEGASGAMRTLAAGKYLNSITGFDEMADRAAQERGFWVWIVNALSSHPVLTWRMWALRDRSRHGKLFLRPDPPALPVAPGGPPPGPYGGGFPDTPRPLGGGFTEPPRPAGGGFTEPPLPYGSYPPYPGTGYGEQPPNYPPGRGN
ncbi:M48 family metallopeptidase [Nocardia sp. NPDC057668]|uniref:M48 family metallopeptidase n=1 Tax=Nocardia sp. NPDC057668 TaxID=3346202 RepID=UPI00366DD691